MMLAWIVKANSSILRESMLGCPSYQHASHPDRQLLLSPIVHPGSGRVGIRYQPHRWVGYKDRQQVQETGP